MAALTGHHFQLELQSDSNMKAMFARFGKVPAGKRYLWLLSLALGVAPLAAMALRGEGGPQDIGAGIGWLRVAFENGYALRHATALLSGLPFAQFQDASLALQTAQRLQKLDAEGDPQVGEALAAAYAVNGDFKQAVKFQQRAIKTAERLSWNLTAMQARLNDYSKDTPLER
jgi:hypothetical protein